MIQRTGLNVDLLSCYFAICHDLVNTVLQIVLFELDHQDTFRVDLTVFSRIDLLLLPGNRQIRPLMKRDFPYRLIPDANPISFLHHF